MCSSLFTSSLEHDPDSRPLSTNFQSCHVYPSLTLVVGLKLRAHGPDGGRCRAAAAACHRDTTVTGHVASPCAGFRSR